MTVYVVLEEDRGLGVMVSGVYATAQQAQAACGNHEWVTEAVFDDAAIRKECADKAVEIADNNRCGYLEYELRAAIEGRP